MKLTEAQERELKLWLESSYVYVPSQATVKALKAERDQLRALMPKLRAFVNKVNRIAELNS